MKKLLTSLLAAVISLTSLTAAASAQQEFPSGTNADTVGAAIDSFYAEHEKECASFSAIVFAGDEVIYSGYYGTTDENGTAADENTVYEWGSISKLFVWVSAMQLHEQGKLDLNADIRTYLPEDFFRKLSYDDPITMLNL